MFHPRTPGEIRSLLNLSFQIFHMAKATLRILHIFRMRMSHNICQNDIISLIIIDRYESSQPAHSSSFLKSDVPPEFTPNGTTEEIDLFQNGVCQGVEGLTTPLCSRHLVGGKCWELS